MSRYVILGFLAAASWAQPPVFSPPRPAVEPAPVVPAPIGSEQPASPTVAVTPPTAVLSQEEQTRAQLFDRLRKWPARTAKDAALILSGLGSEARSALLAGLQDGDWRVQSGCAFALGQTGDATLFAPLKAALSDPSNRASLPELLGAVVRVDPAGGSEAVIPFLRHGSPKVRSAARRCLPETLPEVCGPEIVAMTRSPETMVRASAMELLPRVPGYRHRPEFLAALRDPEAYVAFAAARHLATVEEPKIRAQLLEAAQSAPLREGAYAMLALVMAEDLERAVLIDEKGPVTERCQTLLTGRDPFYVGTAAVVLANVSYRSEDPTLRRLADRYLCPILLSTVAGGVFFSDYTSLEDLAWNKLALLSGQEHGRRAEGWREWWRQNEGTFVARRELRSLAAGEMAQVRIRLERTGTEGSHSRLFSGRADDLGTRGVLVFGEDDGERLAELMAKSQLFSSRGDPETGAPVLASFALEVTLPASAMSFERRHEGAVPEELRELVAFLETLPEKLSWQRFIPGGLVEPTSFLAEQRAFFGSDPAPEVRDGRLRELALSAWPDLDADGKALALSLFEGAPRPWRDESGLALAALLESEPRPGPETLRLMGLLATQDHPEVRRMVLDAVTREPGLAGDEALRRFLAGQTMPGVVALMRDDRARVRALAAETLPRFRNEGDVVSVLLQGLQDFEPEVQNACIQSLATMEDDRVLAMLEAVVQSGESLPARMRAIEAMGSVGGDQVVPRLRELFSMGDSHQKWTVIRALGRARGPAAVRALTNIVRGPDTVDLRGEALHVLASLGGQDVGDQLAGLLPSLDRDPALQMITIESLATVLGQKALPVLAQHLEGDPAVARVAALTLGRLEDVTVASRLLDLMARAEGDMAAEKVFQDLTFFVSEDPSPPRRYAESRAWFEAHREESRRDWFLRAATAVGGGCDPTVDWLQGRDLGRDDQEYLLSLVRDGNRSLRSFADQALQRNLGSMPGDVNEEDPKHRAAQWETRLR